MKFVRGRVAITLHAPFHPAGHESAAEHNSLVYKMGTCRIHMGHIRTLLLGELYCARRGIPYHIRIDGIGPDVKLYHESLIDLMGCIAWFGIQADEVYRARMSPRHSSFYEARLPSDGWAKIQELRAAGGRTDTDYWPVMTDDLEHFPSLLIRGVDWAMPERCAPDWPSFPTFVPCNVERLIEYEETVYGFLGMKRPQLTLPLIGTLYDAKVSKSLGGYGWDILRMVSAEDARAYLVATAVNPIDPLAAIGAELPDEKSINLTEHTWSWETWGLYVRSLSSPKAGSARPSIPRARRS